MASIVVGVTRVDVTGRQFGGAGYEVNITAISHTDQRTEQIPLTVDWSAAVTGSSDVNSRIADVNSNIRGVVVQRFQPAYPNDTIIVVGNGFLGVSLEAA